MVFAAALQLYEQILAENEKLKAQLRDTDLELADLKLQLEKATQVRAECPHHPHLCRGWDTSLIVSAVLSEAGTLR